jgi:ribonuclease HII
MPHPLFGKRLSRLSVADIRMYIDMETPDGALVERLERDPRRGIRAIAKSFVRERERERRIDDRMEELLAIERTLREAGSHAIAGLDEAGRGPLAGPATVGCVILPEAGGIRGLDDSKRLTAAVREEMYARIVETARAWCVVTVSHLEIDEFGILGAVLRGMRGAVERLALRPDMALVDGNVEAGLVCRERAIVDGDARCVSIAAASVLAKVTRDRIMRELDERFPQYGFGGHKGYGCREHTDAIRAHGPCELHRFSYHPVIDMSPQGKVRTALETRLGSAETAETLESAANGIRRNGERIGEADLDYLRGVYRECRKRFV